jgi:hypothetical protein
MRDMEGNGAEFVYMKHARPVWNAGTTMARRGKSEPAPLKPKGAARAIFIS